MRAYYVLRQLALRHEVHLLSFVRSEDPPEAFEHLRQFCKQVVGVEMKRSRLKDLLALLASLAEGIPFLITRDRSSDMERRIQDLVHTTSFDAVHADQLWMAPYALKARECASEKAEHPLLVLDQHNAVFRIPERMAVDARNALTRGLLKREARLMRKFEQATCNRFDRVTWVIAEDRDAVRGSLHNMPPPGSTVSSQRDTVLPICVDPAVLQVVEQLTDEPIILFVGGMHWPPNADGVVWFAEQVLPRVRERVPGARLLAIGKAPPKAIQSRVDIEAPGFIKTSNHSGRKAGFLLPRCELGEVCASRSWMPGLTVSRWRLPQSAPRALPIKMGMTY